MKHYFGSYCGATDCYTNQKYNPELSLFRFPKDPERSKKWLNNVKREDLMKKDTLYLYNNIKICALHFEASQFMNIHKKKLVWNAVPTLFNFSNKSTSVSLKQKIPNSCSESTPKKLKLFISEEKDFMGNRKSNAAENVEYESSSTEILIVASEKLLPMSNKDEEILRLNKRIYELKKQLRCKTFEIVRLNRRFKEFKRCTSCYQRRINKKFRLRTVIENKKKLVP